MKFFIPLLFSFQLFITSSTFSQSAKITIAKEPAWITKNEIDFTNTTLDKDADDGFIDIDLERQFLLAEQSMYVRRSKKILSQAGVQNGSEVSVSYDPAYQRVIFHSIHVIRNKEKTERLKLSSVKTVHQEEELTNFIYNGMIDAVVILEDIRQGDIIEYSYTLQGFNPIFKNKYTAEFNLNFSVPVYNIYYKIVIPPGRKLNYKNLNNTSEPLISASNGPQVMEWRKTNVPPLVLQDYTPSWFDPYSKIYISEYNSWKEVNSWAMELFPAGKSLSSALQKKIEEIKNQFPDVAGRTQAALKFVQDEVRYMGIEIGVNTHKPADPSKVFAQRFGDCKEKSYLLCCILKALDIEASPVMINTVSKRSINNMLPAPTIFDHVTVRVKIDTDYYWFDPTIAYQRGDIRNIFYPDYETGFVITDSSTALTSIPFRNISYQHIKEYFRVTDLAGEGTLVVTTAFYGDDADNIRSEFNNSSNKELMTSFQKFYSSYYEDIKADSVTYKDDDSTGIFTTKEYYSIPDFWKTDTKNIKRFSFAAFTINSSIKRVKEKDRKMPISLLFPAKYKEELTVELPQEWNVTESETHIKNECYAYNYKFYCVNNLVHLVSDYENLKNHATVQEAPIYFRDLNQNEDFASFEISLGGSVAVGKSEKSTDKSNANLLSILVVGAIIAGVVWWSKRN